MKKLMLVILLFLPFAASAQNESLISYDDSTKTVLRNFRPISILSLRLLQTHISRKDSSTRPRSR